MLSLLTFLMVLLPAPLDGMVFVKVKADTYIVGVADHPRNPVRKVSLAAFEIATTEVTNEQFAEFIEATGYVTDAENNGFGMSFEEGMEDWRWESVPGATWLQPFGPNRPGIGGRDQHPVTQISYNDAQAYCRWADCRLPTVEEWEVAARAGRSSRWPWGEQYNPGGRQMANTWQGQSHQNNTREDGYVYTAPVKQYPPNEWGLYDVIGNVFEYCVDERSPIGAAGPMAAGRGGSWWCSEGTCDFFNLIDIGRMDPRATLPNQGFRVVRDIGG